MRLTSLSKNGCSFFFTLSTRNPPSYPLENTVRSRSETEPLDKRNRWTNGGFCFLGAHRCAAPEAYGAESIFK